MENIKKSYSDDDARNTASYTRAVYLLNEKREIQARLREVDRKLRELESLTTGVTRLAREDLDRNVRSFHA